MERKLTVSQLAERACIHSLTHADEPLVQTIRDMARFKNGEIAQMRAAITLACRIAPPIRTVIERFFLKDSLPFSAPSELVAHGFNKTVWKITPPDLEPVACRVHFHTLGRSTDELVQYVKEKRSTYNAVLSAFAGYENLITPTQFMVAASPTLGRAAAIELSPFVEGIDIFALTHPEILSPGQKRHAYVIAEVASHKIGTGYLDLLGDQNILVNGRGETHIVDWETTTLSTRDYHFQHHQRVRQLRDLAA